MGDKRTSSSQRTNYGISISLAHRPLLSHRTGPIHQYRRSSVIVEGLRTCVPTLLRTEGRRGQTWYCSSQPAIINKDNLRVYQRNAYRRRCSSRLTLSVKLRHHDVQWESGLSSLQDFVPVNAHGSAIGLSGYLSSRLAGQFRKMLLELVTKTWREIDRL